MFYANKERLKAYPNEPLSNSAVYTHRSLYKPAISLVYPQHVYRSFLYTFDYPPSMVWFYYGVFAVCLGHDNRNNNNSQKLLIRVSQLLIGNW